MYKIRLGESLQLRFYNLKQNLKRSQNFILNNFPTFNPLKKQNSFYAIYAQIFGR